MDNLDFSEEEIQQQLAVLGYKNIPKHRLREFKHDLDELIHRGPWKTVSAGILKTNKPQTLSQSSPPAYIKEKVSHSDHPGGFFLHAEQINHDRKLLPTQRNRNYGWQQGYGDSYAQHSVAPKLQLPPGAPNRLEVELDVEDTLDSLLSDSYTSVSSLYSQQRHFMKRKVLRKHKGESVVCDESVDSEGSDATSCLEDQVAELDQSTSPQKDFESESETGSDQGDSGSSEADGLSLSVFESYIRGMTRSQSDDDVRPKPKSFIRPVMSQQNLKKTDPVSKFAQYKEIWEKYPVPGEKERRALRWEVKERLAHQPPPPKPPRVYMPNTYVVPTLKKRSALRWEVRNDLAHGLLPQRSNYQF